jgi:hypothetical protein
MRLGPSLVPGRPSLLGCVVRHRVLVQNLAFLPIDTVPEPVPIFGHNPGPCPILSSVWGA